MQCLHAAPAYLCGSQRAELFGWLVSWHPKRPQQSRATHAGKRQAAPLHAAVRKKYLENRIQFVHVDDMARLIAFILRKTEPEAQRLTILNVAGRGEPLTFEQ